MKDSKQHNLLLLALTLSLAFPLAVQAQRVLTLDSVRAMALAENKQLKSTILKQDVAVNTRKATPRRTGIMYRILFKIYFVIRVPQSTSHIWRRSDASEALRPLYASLKNTREDAHGFAKEICRLKAAQIRRSKRQSKDYFGVYWHSHDQFHA